MERAKNLSVRIEVMPAHHAAIVETTASVLLLKSLQKYCFFKPEGEEKAKDSIGTFELT